MSIGPLLPGRLPNSLAATRLQTSLASLNHSLATLQDQTSTGQKFFLPSDSPAAAIRTVALQRTIERQDYYHNNILASQAFLNTTGTSLDTVANAANRAKAIILQGVGEGSTPDEKVALATEVSSLIDSVLAAANTKVRGRYIFAGSATGQQPFDIVDGSVVRYNGDAAALDALLGPDVAEAANIDGQTAFAVLSQPVSADVNPALTLDTRVGDLLGGRGVVPGKLSVTVDDGVNPVSTQEIDLTGAETVRDIQARLQAAFPPGSLTVDVDPAGRSGLRLSAAGSVAVTDLAGSNVAQRLGIAGGPAAVIHGTDIDPRLTLQTKLSDFNGGAGLANPNGTFLITNGNKSATIDVSSAVTVEDLFNTLNAAGLDLSLGLNAAGNGLAISTRLSGAAFSIGENGGTTASDLGIRTFTGSTLLSSLNRGAGVPVDVGTTLNIRLNSGATYNIDVRGLNTVQDVINSINAAGDPNLSASLNANGNGITVTDASTGSSGFSIEANAAGAGLGIAGSQPGNGSIVGTDVNPQETHGLLSLLLSLKSALESGDNAELSRIDPLMDREINRLNIVRGDVGSRLSFLDDVQNRLDDQNVNLRQSLSNDFDTDMTEAITKLMQTSTVLQATLRMASQTQQLTLFNFL